MLIWIKLQSDGQVCLQEGNPDRIVRKCRQLINGFHSALAAYEVVHCDCEEFYNETVSLVSF